MHMLKDGRFVIGTWRAAGGRRSIARRDQELGRERHRALSAGAYEVGVEQEPGSGGKESAEPRSAICGLQGVCRQGDRLEGGSRRAVCGASPGGNVSDGRSWQTELLDETDVSRRQVQDQVDACSGAFNRLVSGPVYNLFGVGGMAVLSSAIGSLPAKIFTSRRARQSSTMMTVPCKQAVVWLLARKSSCSQPSPYGPPPSPTEKL